MRPLRVLAAVLGTLLGAVALASPASGQAAAPAGCRALSAGQIPFAALEASYRRLTGLPAATKLSKTQPQRYGVCGSNHYAFALLLVAQGAKLTYRQQVAQQDHSPIWVRKRGGEWVDEGLDSLCKLAPPALINIWKVGVRCR
jgi:hypothetical protein